MDFRLTFTQIFLHVILTGEGISHKLSINHAYLSRNFFKNSEATFDRSQVFQIIAMLKRYKLGINAKEEGIIKDL